MPAAAMMPACRMPLPNILRKRRARTMKSREPHTTEPTGRRQALRHAEGDRVDVRARSRDAGRFSATAALNRRAPSRCTGTLAPCATAATAAISSGVMQVPPWPLCVFSSTRAPSGAGGCSPGRSASRTCSGVRKPRAVFTGRICTPPSRALPADLGVEDVAVDVEHDFLARLRVRAAPRRGCPACPT